MDQYEIGKFSQLAVAHKCSLLYFTKDKFSTLGKKLRPEFERLYLSSELKDCVKLLGKTIGEGSEPKNIVDLVLADYDSAAVRLVDAVNKRAIHPQTKNCPIIPIVILLSSDTNDKEAAEHLRGAGGVTKLLKHPIDTKDLLYAIMDVLTTQKKVEETFRSLTRKKVISSKYPFMPIFDKATAELEPVVEEQMTRKSFKVSDLESVRSHNTAGSTGHNDKHIEDIDDVTECSSLLPDFVKNARKEHPELNSPYKQQRLRAATAEEEDEEQRLHEEAAELEAWRNRREDDLSVESSQQLDRPSEFITTDENAPLMDARFLGSVDPLADAFQYSNSSLDKSSIASMVRKHQRAEELGVGPHSVMSGTTATPANKAQEFLSNKLRPVWQDFKIEPTAATTHKKPTLAEILGMTSSPTKSKKDKLAFTQVHDIHPFVNKPPPLIQRPSTVGGLDKRSADSYWRAFKPRKADGTTQKKDRDMKVLTPSESFIDLPTIDESTGLPRSSTAKLFTSAPHSTKSPHGTSTIATFDMAHLAQFGMMDTHSGDHTDGPAHPHRRLSHASMSSASNSHISKENMSRDAMSRDTGMSRDFGSRDNLGTVLMSPTKAEKKIIELASELPPDLQVSALMDINFSNRKINLGEKEMLLKGLRLESEGDRESALSCYTRAGMHSKDPQISKMLIGNLNYKQGKLMNALNFYTLAVQILSARSEGSTRAVLDEFIAYRNRGIINFRLGDDHTGLQDIEHAVTLMPQDIELRELISLAKRRMGKYHQAIQEATVAKTIRNEKIREEKLQELQRDILRRKKFMKAEKERSRQRNAGAVVYNESAQFVNFASRSSRHASVLAKPVDAIQSSDVSVTSSDVQGNAAANLAAFAETARDDDINARLLQTRGYVLNIDEPNCHNSLRDRVKESRRLVKANAENDETNSEDTFLRVFKMNNGYKADLFKDIFERPSELQTALLVHPENRSAMDIHVIATTLKLFPIMCTLSDSKIKDLAKLLEYRALTSKDTIFAQNDQASAVCFLLSGHVQVKMEKQSAGQTTIDIVIWDVPQYTSFGYIDFLFRNNNPRIMAEVEAAIRPSKAHKRVANTSKSGSGHVKREFLTMTNSIEEGDEELGDNDSSIGGDAAPPMLTMAGRPGVVDRSLAPGMFKTYAIQSMCELLMLRDIDFEKMLLGPAIDDLKRRLDAIRSCGIFNEWSQKHHVRLARMGQIKRVRKGETILSQGSKPNYLYIIMKGMCLVQKQPNRTEMLVQKLTVAKEKAVEFDSKYLFDHKLCGVLKMANLKEEFKAANADQPDVNFTLADAKRNPDSILRSSYVTVSELERYKLQLEINKLEGLIQSAALEDAKELDNDLMSSSRKYPSSANNNTTSSSNNANNNTSSGIPVLELKVADIATIQWPKIFGEACVIDPENGRSRGSIVADTACDIFMLHKTQIQTFPVDDTFLSNVKVKAVAYPGDPDVVVSLFRKQGWKKYREEVMQEIPKDRWPMNEASIREPFRIN